MDWTGRLTSTISYASESSFSDGDIVYGTVTTAKARIIQRVRTIVDSVGIQRDTSHEIATTTNIPRGARVWLPGGNTAQVGQSYTVYATTTAAMLDGSYTLYILTLGKNS